MSNSAVASSSSWLCQKEQQHQPTKFRDCCADLVCIWSCCWGNFDFIILPSAAAPCQSWDAARIFSGSDGPHGRGAAVEAGNACENPSAHNSWPCRPASASAAALKKLAARRLRRYCCCSLHQPSLMSTRGRGCCWSGCGWSCSWSSNWTPGRKAKSGNQIRILLCLRNVGCKPISKTTTNQQTSWITDFHCSICGWPFYFEAGRALMIEHCLFAYTKASYTSKYNGFSNSFTSIIGYTTELV